VSEIELKLAGRTGDLERVKDSLAGMAASAPVPVGNLISTYYDSPDLKLRSQHLTLQIRLHHHRRIQTLKREDPAGGHVLSRDEYEDEIAGQEPDFNAPNTGRRLQDAIDEQELRPLFRTIVRRTVIDLQPQSSARIEAAIDEGEIVSIGGDARQALSEIELEVKHGDPALAYDIGQQLLTLAPLRIETSSKAARGYRLVSTEPASAVAAGPVDIDESMTVDSVLQAIGRAGLGHILANQPAVLAGDPEGIHQMRVAARRLRSALSTLKPALPADQYRWAADELKWLAGPLGAARNCDVFSSSLLAPVTQALPRAADWRHLAAAAERQRMTAYARVTEAIGSRRYTNAMLRLGRWFEGREWRDQADSDRAALLATCIGDVAPGLIERRWRQVRKRSKGFAELSPKQRHRLRIALKKLRYTVDCLESAVAQSQVAALKKRTKPLQDDLGQLNDVRTAYGLIAPMTEASKDHGMTWREPPA